VSVKASTCFNAHVKIAPGWADGIASDSSSGHIYATNVNNSTTTVYKENGTQITPSGNFPNLKSPCFVNHRPLLHAAVNAATQFEQHWQ